MLDEPVALYARIAKDTKDALDRYAVSRGMSLASAVQDLLNSGLESAQRAVDQVPLAARIASLEAELAETSRDRDQEVVARQQLESEFAALAGAWTQRANARVGRCPDCTQALTGSDLLVLGSCPNCGRSIAGLLAPAKASGLDDRELMMVFGAAGLLLGAIALASKAGGG